MGVLSVMKDYGTEILNSIRDNDLKTFRQVCEKHLRYDAKIAELCVMDIKHRPSQKFACPLILASRLDDPSIIKYMLEIGVNPNFVHHTAYTTKRKETLTPLHVAVELSLRRTVDLLTRYNADPNVPDHNDDSPFIMAVKKADWVIMKMLLSCGANAMLPDRFNNAPIHIATLYGHLQIVKTLIKNGADIHQKGNLGVIPSHIAAKEGHVHLVQVYCSSAPALINAKIPCYEDKREKAQIHLACLNGHAETVIALLDQFGADVNIVDSNLNTALHCLVLHPFQPNKMRDKDYFYATAKILVRYHAKFNERNKDGDTPLHLAAAHGHPKIVELLLNIGANPMTENNNRLKPIDLVPESDAISKQLLKDHMLNPKPAMNLSSLSLNNNSSFHIGVQKFDHSSRNNSTKVSPVMARSYNEQSMKRLKPQNISMSSSSSSVFIKDPKKHSYFSPRMRNELMHPIHEDHHHHLPPTGFFPSSLEQSSKSIKYMKKKNHYDSSMETSSAYNNARHRKQRYSSDETSTTYEKHRKATHRRHRSSDSREHVRRRRRKGSYAHYEEHSDSTLRNRKISKANQDSFSSDEGIRITTVEGKPKMIEVEYEKGPITIEFDNEEDVFPQEKEKKKTSKKNREMDRHDKMTRRSKSKDDIDQKNKNIQKWYEEMKAKKKKTKKGNDESEDSENSSLDEAVIKKEIPKREERNRKKGKSNRQKQYEEQLEMERMPIEDPEPPIKNYDSKSELDSESLESEELEDEIKSTQRLLNESASKRIFDVVESMKSRWSTHEYDSDDEKDTRNPVVHKNTQSKDDHKKDVKLNENNIHNSENISFKEFSTPLIETSPSQTIKLETLVLKDKKKAPSKYINSSHTTQRVLVEKETTFDVERKGSLNLRVSGHTPKAYNRGDKNAARKEFFSAQPVKIESSSEASDAEWSSNSLRRQEWRKPSPPVFPGPPRISLEPKNEKTFEVNKEYSHFLKPYQSIGKIEVKSNLIDEAVNEESCVTTVTTKNIKKTSDTKILPEHYQIKNKKQDHDLSEDRSNESENNQDDQDKLMSTDLDERGKKRKENVKKSEKQRKNNSLEHLLENYDEEPSVGTKKADQDDVLIDLNEFKKEIEKEYLESQELKNNELNKSTDLSSIRSDSVISDTSFEYENASISKNSKPKTTLKTEKKRERSKKKEEAELGSDDSASTLQYDFNYGKSNSQKIRAKYRNGNKIDEPERSNKSTRNKISKSIDNQSSLESVENNKKVKKLDSDKLGLDIVIPSTHKDDEDTKAPYMKLNPEMYESFTGRKKNIKENKSKNSLKEVDGKPGKSSNLSSKEYKPPKPQTSPLPQRRNARSARRAEEDISSHRRDSDADDLNYKGYSRKKSTFLPKQPNRPYDVHKMSGFSDTETMEYTRVRKRNKAHSEAELSDFEPPDKSSSGLSYKQLALNSLKFKTQRSQNKLNRPRSVPHNDKSFRNLLKLNKAYRRRRRRGDHTQPTAGWYGHYELKRVISLQSFSGSELDVDPDFSFISDEEWSSEELSASNMSLCKKYENPVYDSLLKFQKLNEVRVEMKKTGSEPTTFLEPDPIVLQKHDEIKKLWMEQVDPEKVQKCETMYLVILSEGQSLPSSIYSLQPDEFGTPPQWVVAKNKRNEKSIEVVDDFNGERVQRNKVLFFKVDLSWIKLAWVLFDRLQDDSETSKMIKDIQLKAPESLSEQIIHMMKRWWSMKKDKATIQELQRSLELAQMFYIAESMSLNEVEEKEEKMRGSPEENLETVDAETLDGSPFIEKKKNISLGNKQAPEETTFSASESHNKKKKKHKKQVKQETNL